MSYRHTYHAALESLHELEIMLKGFPTNGNIPAIEIDLTLQKLRNLYELFLMMKAPAAIPEPVILPVVEQPVPQTATAPKTQKSEDKVEILSDHFKGRETLHENLHQTIKQTDTLGYVKPVSDIMKAIGINDRFTFLRELFSEDIVAYENTMHHLNEAGSYEEARDYLVSNFSWEMDSEAVLQLLEIINRKFNTGA
jgi:hypothetical protein